MAIQQSVQIPIEARSRDGQLCHDPAAYAQQFRDGGFAVFPRLLGEDEVDRLRRAIEAIPDCDAVRRKRNVYGVRNLLDLSPDVRRLARLPEIRRLVTPILGEEAFAARAIFFDKVPGANWALGWHQDSLIAVAEKGEAPGFLAWGQKAGVWPPPSCRLRSPVPFSSLYIMERLN